MMLAGAVLALWPMGAASEETVRLEIKSFPEKPPARVWIDGSAMEPTPLSLPYFKPGQRTIRVSRLGIAIEREVLIRPGKEVILVADFIKNDFRVENEKVLGYKPLVGNVKVIITSTDAEPDAPKPPPVTEPAPLVKPTPEKPAPQPATPEPTPTAPLVPSAPAPEKTKQEYYGPPAPEKYLHPEKPKTEPEPQPQPEPTPLIPPPKPEPPTPAPTPKHPCPQIGAKDCANYPTGVRGAVYTYYCRLVNNDFDRAYAMRVPVNDLAWFYRVASSFCGLADFEIRGFETRKIGDNSASAHFVVDLKNASGRTVESWQMELVLVNQHGTWLIKSTAGKKAGP